MGKYEKWISAALILCGLFLILWGGPSGTVNEFPDPETETVATTPAETEPITETEAPTCGGFREVNGLIHYYDKDDNRVTGWLDLDGQQYYLTQEGITTGISSVDGILYIFDREGKLASNCWTSVENGIAYGDHNGNPGAGVPGESAGYCPESGASHGREGQTCAVGYRHFARRRSIHYRTTAGRNACRLGQKGLLD